MDMNNTDTQEQEQVNIPPLRIEYSPETVRTQAQLQAHTETICQVNTSFGKTTLKKVLEPENYVLTENVDLKKFAEALVHSDEVNKVKKRDKDTIANLLSEELQKIVNDVTLNIQDLIAAALPQSVRYPSYINDISLSIVANIEIPKYEGIRETLGGSVPLSPQSGDGVDDKTA